MRPDYYIAADGSDITALINDRLLELVITDKAGFESDTISIKLDNRDGKVAKPELGAKLSVSMGYKETGLTHMGKYIVSSVNVSGPPHSMAIDGRAADFLEGLKVRRHISWDETTIGAIVAKIAARHGLAPKTSHKLANIEVKHVDQSDSDLNFLTRLLARHGGVVKPAGGYLVTAPRGEAKSVSGRNLAPVNLGEKDLITWSMTQEGRAKHGKVRAYWRDVDEGKRQFVEIGGGDGPTEVVLGQHPNEAEARKAAEAKLKALLRGVESMELECKGDPGLLAEAPLTVSGIIGIDGKWIIDEAVHTMNNEGYGCSVSAKRKI